MSKILVLGNGESVLKDELGTVIDNYPTVGRVNNYTTKGFEKYIGSKTDIWFNGANQALKKRREKPKRIVVLIPPSELIRKGEKIHPRIRKRLQIPAGRYELVPLYTMKIFAQSSGVSRPTTGLAAILWALENYDEVVIHGFDFFLSSKGHYNDSIITRWLIASGLMKKAKNHDLFGEKNYVRSLHQSEKLKLLTELAGDKSSQ